MMYEQLSRPDSKAKYVDLDLLNQIWFSWMSMLGDGIPGKIQSSDYKQTRKSISTQPLVRHQHQPIMDRILAYFSHSKQPSLPVSEGTISSEEKSGAKN
jgi:hypothetical protein